MIIIVSDDDSEAKGIADKILLAQKQGKVDGYSREVQLKPYEMKILVRAERIRIIDGT